MLYALPWISARPSTACLTICKLHAYGFSRDACKLIANYLYRRKQRVEILKSGKILNGINPESLSPLFLDQQLPIISGTIIS